MENKTLYTIIVHSENIAGLLNQVTAVFTRRQINIESLNVEKVVRQIEKKMDVIQAHYFTDKEIFQREVAMYKVSTPEFQNNPEASKVVRRFNAHIVEVNPVFSIIEMVGMSDEITFLYEDLKRLKCVLQFVRSGRIAVSTSCFERVNEYLAHREERYKKGL